MRACVAHAIRDKLEILWSSLDLRLPFLIETVIPFENAGRREAARPAHLGYLEERAAEILAAGAKLNDDGSVGNGSFYLLATLSRAEAESFIAADPYVRDGVATAFTIQKVRTGFFDGKRREKVEP